MHPKPTKQPPTHANSVSGAATTAPAHQLSQLHLPAPTPSGTLLENRRIHVRSCGHTSQRRPKATPLLSR